MSRLVLSTFTASRTTDDLRADNDAVRGRAAAALGVLCAAGSAECRIGDRGALSLNASNAAASKENTRAVLALVSAGVLDGVVVIVIGVDKRVPGFTPPDMGRDFAACNFPLDFECGVRSSVRSRVVSTSRVYCSLRLRASRIRPNSNTDRPPEMRYMQVNSISMNGGSIKPMRKCTHQKSPL
jgi:hypothetical protein